MTRRGRGKSTVQNDRENFWGKGFGQSCAVSAAQIRRKWKWVNARHHVLVPPQLWHVPYEELEQELEGSGALVYLCAVRAIAELRCFQLAIGGKRAAQSITVLNIFREKNVREQKRHWAGNALNHFPFL